VTLLGPGGTGKTRLAIATAERVREQFAGGVWFVDLAPLTREDTVAQAILKALKVNIAGQSEMTETEMLRTALASQEILLVLDNAEHVLESAVTLAYSLLSSCSDLKILATSRQALSLAGEQIFYVPSLAMPPATIETAEHLLEYAAVQLFVERATQASSHFRLSQSNAEAIAEICRRLDGIPLALEMAATRTRYQQPAQIAAQLIAQIDTLASGNNAVPRRQQSLQATIAWSYDLLSTEEQTLFRALSVFSGGWTHEAAEALVPGATTLLLSLVEKSLVVYQPDYEGDNTGDRFSLLQTLQQFGASQCLLEGESDAWRAKHLIYFCDLCQESFPKQTGPDAAHELERIEQEHDNIRAALAFGVRENNVAMHQQVLSLVGNMLVCWQLHHHLREARQWQEAVLKLPLAQENTILRAKCLVSAGTTLYLMGDYSDARVYYQESIALQRAQGDDQYMAPTLANLANISFMQGDFTAALAYNEEALTLARAANDNARTMRILLNIADACLELSQEEKAQQCAEESRTLALVQGDQWLVGHIMTRLATLAERRDDRVAAVSLTQESLTIGQSFADKRMVASALNKLASFARHAGDLVTARRYNTEGLLLNQEAVGLELCMMILADLARLDRAEGHLERAARLWGAVTTLHQKLGDSTIYIYAQEEARASVYDALGNTIYTNAFDEGCQLTLPQVIALATASLS
jgi:predicted ATPase